MYSLPNLPPAVAREVFANLCATLPPPVADTAETCEIRNVAAMAAVAALHPVDAFEVRLAAEAIAADAYTMDCLRLATEHRDDLMKTFRYRAQACAMMRQVQRTLRALRALQPMKAARQAAVPASVPGESQRPRPTAPRRDKTQAARDLAPPDGIPSYHGTASHARRYETMLIPPAQPATKQFRAGRRVQEVQAVAGDPAVVEALVNGTSGSWACLTSSAATGPKPPDGIVSPHSIVSHMLRNETIMIHPNTQPPSNSGPAGACRRLRPAPAIPAAVVEVVEALVNGISPILGVLDDLGGDRTEAILWDSIMSRDGVACVAE